MRADALAAHGLPSAGSLPPSAGYLPLPEETRALGCGRAPGGGGLAAARAAAARRELRRELASGDVGSGDVVPAGPNPNPSPEPNPNPNPNPNPYPKPYPHPDPKP